MVIAEKKENSQAFLNNPNMLAKRAKREIVNNGFTDVICPRCGTMPEITITEKGERTIVSCECGYIHDIEINF